VSGTDDLRELLGEDVSTPELERLQRAHDALRATPAPPEIPDSLTTRALAIPEEGRSGFHRRRILQGLAVAAVIAGAAFGIGFWAGGGDSGFPVAEVITLSPTEAGPADAKMVIDMRPRDDAGNWRMAADVTGLPPLPAGGYYEVWLTQGTDVVESCGRFVVNEQGSAERVWLNAPYPLKEYDRWVVSAHVPGEQESGWLLDGPVATSA
jgi:hypothetical protein